MVGDAEPSQPARGENGGAGGAGETAPALIVTAPDSANPRSTPVYDWLMAGRECSGVDERHRLVIDDPAVSRTHLEFRLDLDLDQAWLTDRSTNGTRLNGRRIERSVPVRIMPGDRVRLGQAELEFRSERFAATADGGRHPAVLERGTIRQITAVEDMVMVVGDIVGFSTIAENTADLVLLENVDRLYAGLQQILSGHRGTLSNYMGDAFFATWEAAAVPDAARLAVAFAVEAAETVPRIASGLDLRDPGGGPVRMGWGVARGPAAVSLITGMLVTVLGDTTNVAFRLSGIAGRDGQPAVLVTDAVYQGTTESFAFTEPSAIQVKGRRQPVEALGAGRLARP
jgi:adenylate cyclase